MTDQMHVDDPRVAAVLAAACAPAEAPLPGEAAALTAFRDVHHPRRRIFHMSRKSENAKLVAAAVFGGAVVLTGAAAAATGALPVGHSHSSHAPKSHTPDATDSQDATDTQTTTGTTPTSNPDKGLSQLAHDTAGPHKGQTICITASKGHCHAAQVLAGTTHGKSDAATHGQAGATSHGQSGAATHGQAGATTHGQAGATTHGQAGATTHGQAGATTHGQAGATTHGQAGATTAAARTAAT
jgi:hypothetical protein